MKLDLIKILIMVVIMNVLTNQISANELYLISTGRIGVYKYENKKMVCQKDLLPFGWMNSYPNYDTRNQKIIFSAVHYALTESGDINSNKELSEGTYEINYKNKKTGVPKIIENVPNELCNPILSLDGTLIAGLIQTKGEYYCYEAIIDLKTGKELGRIKDITDKPLPVWINNSQLLYLSTDDYTKLYDLKTGKSTVTKLVKGIYPISAKSPTGPYVLCTNFNADTMYLLNTETFNLKVLFKSRFFSLGAWFAFWRPDGQSFFYTQQTWKTLLRFSESKVLSLYNIKTGKKTHFDYDMSAINGGVFIGYTEDDSKN